RRRRWRRACTTTSAGCPWMMPKTWSLSLPRMMRRGRAGPQTAAPAGRTGAPRCAEATGGYDPSKFAHIDRLPDRDMEAAYDQIQAEERRALRIARTEDEREAEREALREAAKRERKRSKKGVHAFLDDGD
ncbi:hypothetical protein ABPG77_009972, partial [Micractinium sp. CCAP 211/92]